MEPFVPVEFECIQDLSSNFKIRLKDNAAHLYNMSPLTINFSYSDNQLKFVQVFISYTNKEPTPQANNGTYVNPTQIKLMGTLMDPKTGKTSFDKDWLYLTVVSQNQGFRIKMVAKFKEDAHA